MEIWPDGVVDEYLVCGLTFPNREKCTQCFGFKFSSSRDVEVRSRVRKAPDSCPLGSESVLVWCFRMSEF
jgi:hypothetical protein